MSCDHSKITISSMMAFPKLGVKDSVLCDYCGETVGTCEWKETGPLIFELMFDPPEIYKIPSSHEHVNLVDSGKLG